MTSNFSQRRLSQQLPSFGIRRTAAVLTLLMLSACTAQLHYRDGVKLIEKEDYVQGLAELRAAADTSSHDADYRSKYLKAKESIVNNLLSEADRLQRNKDDKGATQLYQQVLHIEPENIRANNGIALIKREQHFQTLFTEIRSDIKLGQKESALSKLRFILAEIPNHVEARLLLDTITQDSKVKNISPELAAAYKKPISIEFKDAALMQIFEIIARSSGLNFVFDKEVRGEQRTSLFLKNGTVESALRYTLLTNQLNFQVLDANTVLIFPNNENKLKEYQELIVKSFFLTNANAKDIATSLQTITKSKNIIVDEKLNAIIMRDHAEAIKAAEKLIAMQDLPEPEVMLEVEVLEIKRSQLQELGIKWPDNFALTPILNTKGGTFSLNDLKNNLNSNTTSVTPPTVNLNMKAQDSDVKILANPRIRTRNNETATIQIGERVPNTTTTSTATGFVSESVTYTDVGLKLEVQPRVFLDNDVGIKVRLEVSNVVNQSQTKSGAIIYQLGTRNASTTLRLKDGETQILAGLINNEDRSTGSKIPGLGDFPIIGRLFGSVADNSQKTEVVLSITPRLIRNITIPPLTISEFSSGTESGLKVNSPLQISGLQNADDSAQAATQMSDNVQSEAPNLQVFLPNETKANENFSVQLALQSKETYKQLVFSLKLNPDLFELIDTNASQISQQALRDAKQTIRADGDQINIFVSADDNKALTASGIVSILNLRPKTKNTKGSIQVVAATGITSDNKVTNFGLPAPQIVSSK